jgi:hypothetical protein
MQGIGAVKLRDFCEATLMSCCALRLGHFLQSRQVRSAILPASLRDDRRAANFFVRANELTKPFSTIGVCSCGGISCRTAHFEKAV